MLNRKAERADAGVYKLILKNPEGSAQVQFRVNVLAPPEKPEGPLEATNVTAEGCTLNWKAPVRYSPIENIEHIFINQFCRKTMVEMK